MKVNEEAALSPDRWRTVVSQNEAISWVTPEEAGEIEEELLSLMQRYARRHDPAQRPPGARPVELIALMHPFDPPDDVDRMTGDDR